MRDYRSDEGIDAPWPVGRAHPRLRRPGPELRSAWCARARASRPRLHADWTARVRRDAAPAAPAGCRSATGSCATCGSPSSSARRRDHARRRQRRRGDSRLRAREQRRPGSSSASRGAQRLAAAGCSALRRRPVVAGAADLEVLAGRRGRGRGAPSAGYGAHRAQPRASRASSRGAKTRWPRLRVGGGRSGGGDRRRLACRTRSSSWRTR